MGAQEAPVSIDCRPPVPEAAGLPQGGKNPVGVVGDGRKIASSRAVRDFGIFKEGHFPMWGSMAQAEVTRLLYCYKNGIAGTNPNSLNSSYIDLAAAMSAVNRKQYHQVKRDGSPLCYAITVTALQTKSGFTVETAENNWTVRNAVKKAAIGWKRQLKHGGVKVSDLPTYAKRFRVGMEEGAYASGAGQQSLTNHLVPILGDQLTSAFEAYTDGLGVSATYQGTNEIVMVPVETDPDVGTVVEYRMKLLGDSSTGNLGIVCEFMKSRRNIRDASDPTLEFPDIDNLLDPLFATADELTDDIVEAAQDFNTQRPYDEEGTCEKYLGARFNATITGGVPIAHSMVAPLGLLKIGGIAETRESGDQTYTSPFQADAFTVDVHAIYEM